MELALDPILAVSFQFVGTIRDLKGMTLVNKQFQNVIDNPLNRCFQSPTVGICIQREFTPPVHFNATTNTVEINLPARNHLLPLQSRILELLASMPTLKVLIWGAIPDCPVVKKAIARAQCLVFHEELPDGQEYTCRATSLFIPQQLIPQVQFHTFQNLENFVVNYHGPFNYNPFFIDERLGRQIKEFGFGAVNYWSSVQLIVSMLTILRQLPACERFAFKASLGRDAHANFSKWEEMQIRRLAAEVRCSCLTEIIFRWYEVRMEEVLDRVLSIAEELLVAEEVVPDEAEFWRVVIGSHRADDDETQCFGLEDVLRWDGWTSMKN